MIRLWGIKVQSAVESKISPYRAVESNPALSASVLEIGLRFREPDMLTIDIVNELHNENANADDECDEASTHEILGTL